MLDQVVNRIAHDVGDNLRFNTERQVFETRDGHDNPHNLSRHSDVFLPVDTLFPFRLVRQTVNDMISHERLEATRQALHAVDFDAVVEALKERLAQTEQVSK